MLLPEILSRAGQVAVFAAEEFFFGKIRNGHTRAAYLHAVRRFLAWCEQRGLELVRIAPRDVGQYFDGLQKETISIATRKLHLSALGERYEVVEGKTPEISVAQARKLLASINNLPPWSASAIAPSWLS